MHRARASAKLASTQNRFTAGRAVFVSASQLADASTQNALHFDEGASGGSFDRETNLNDNWHRTYDPLSGRYTTADPLGLRGGDLSLYLYAKNNPLSFTDPRGESTALGIALGVASVYAIGIANGWWNLPTVPGKPSDDPFGSGGLITPFSPSGGGGSGSDDDYFKCLERCDTAKAAGIQMCQFLYGPRGVLPNDDKLITCVHNAVTSWENCRASCQKCP